VKLYEITIRPVSGFGTPLKGDTLFGHFCWQAAYDASILNGGLNQWIACYAEKPCAVFQLPGQSCATRTAFIMPSKDRIFPLAACFPQEPWTKRRQWWKERKTQKRNGC